MDKKQFVLDYIKATHAQNERNAKFEQTFELVTDGHIVFEPVVYELYQLHESAIAAVLGQEAYDTVLWYLYERPLHDDDKPNYWIHDVEYCIQTPEQLVDICLNGLLD